MYNRFNLDKYFYYRRDYRRYCGAYCLRCFLAIVIFCATAGASFAADTLKLDETSIVGTRELPKVLYIVPWKDSNVGLLTGQAQLGRFDAGMVPVERESYTREIEYFEMLKGDQGVAK